MFLKSLYFVLNEQSSISSNKKSVWINLLVSINLENYSKVNFLKKGYYYT